MKISEMLFTTPFWLFNIVAHWFYILMCLITFAWACSSFDLFRGKINRDPFVGMGFLFFIIWLIATAVFCFYWGNQFQEWGY
jgi:hypothetical protein